MKVISPILGDGTPEPVLLSARACDHESMLVLADIYEGSGAPNLAQMFRLGIKGFGLSRRFRDHKDRLWKFGWAVEGVDRKVVSDKITEAALKEIHEGIDPTTVFCTACGQKHTGPRIKMAKLRKCCTTSTKDRKFCRSCGVVVTREEYLGMGWGAKNKTGWGTFSNCESCGTTHRRRIERIVERAERTIRAINEGATSDSIPQGESL